MDAQTFRSATIRPLQVALALLAVVAPAQASAQTSVTVGDSATERDIVDLCGVCTFVTNQAFGQAGLTLSTYSFFAREEADITPLLLTRVDTGDFATFTVAGVGATRLSSLGVNTFDFGLTAGTALTAVNSYFGFANTGGNNVTFSYFDPGEEKGTFLSSAIDLGDEFTVDASFQQANSGFMTRTYSINATAVGETGGGTGGGSGGGTGGMTGAVPEPATWAMMIAGFGAAGASLRRRRRAKGAVAFA